MPQPDFDFQNKRVKNHYLISTLIYSNEKTQVYGIIDMDNLQRKLVIKLKNKNFDRATRECKVMETIKIRNKMNDIPNSAS